MQIESERLGTCTEIKTTPRIVVEERGKKFEIKNAHGITIHQIVVDGCLITDDRERCDYLFEIGEPCHCAVYLELKGSDIAKAYKQLTATLGYLAVRHKSTRRVCHIVANRVPKAGPAVQSLKLKMLRHYDTILHVGTNEQSIDVNLAPYCRENG